MKNIDLKIDLKIELRKLRKSKNLTQNQLALILRESGILKNCTAQVISNKENYSFEHIELFEKIAYILGYKVDFTVTKNDSK